MRSNPTTVVNSRQNVVHTYSCPFGRMVSAQVLLGPTPFRRRDTVQQLGEQLQRPDVDCQAQLGQALSPNCSDWPMLSSGYAQFSRSGTAKPASKRR